jgi:hypothetical protein
MWTTMLVSLFSGAAEAREYRLNSNVSSISLDDALTLSPNWIDVSGSDYVISVDLRNESREGLMVRSSGIRCVRGTWEGATNYGASFGIGERTIDLQPGETKSVKLLCDHGRDVEGDFALKIDRVEAMGGPEVTVVTVGFDGVDVREHAPGETVFANVIWRLRERDVERRSQLAGKQLATGAYDRAARRPPPPPAAPAIPAELPPPPPAAIITHPSE